MADISKITTLNGTAYDIKDANAIHNGTALMTTNPFAGDGHNASALYIPKIDNALYCAAKRFNVTVSGEYIAFNGADSLFSGMYDGNNLRIADGKQVTITIDFSNCSGSKMPGYPYGYIYMTFYASGNGPKAISARVYNNYASSGVGWKPITFNKVFGSVYMAEQSYYGLQTIEITLTGSDQTSYGYTALSQIDMWLTRPDPSNTPFLFKGGAQTLYYNLTAPAFIGSGASLTNLNANNIASGTVPVARLPVATSSANGVTKLYTGANSNAENTAVTPASLYNMANRSICPYYSTSATYAVGDKVRNGDYIYECITAITKAEAWTAAHWQIAPTLQEQITALPGNDIVGMTVNVLKASQSGYIVGLTVDQLKNK